MAGRKTLVFFPALAAVLLGVAAGVADFQHGHWRFEESGSDDDEAYAKIGFSMGLSTRKLTCSGGLCERFGGTNEELTLAEYCDRISVYPAFTEAASPCASLWGVVDDVHLANMALALTGVTMALLSCWSARGRMPQRPRPWPRALVAAMSLSTVLLSVEVGVLMDVVRRSCSDAVPDIGSSVAVCEAGKSLVLVLAAGVAAFLSAAQSFDVVSPAL